MSTLRGDLGTLKKFSASLRRMPTVVAQKIATATAPKLTEAARETFAQSEDAYGAPWMPGAKGQTVTLRKSGALLNTLEYVAIGTLLRVALAVSYAKYQVGRRPVTPRQGEPLPIVYLNALALAAKSACQAELRS